MGFNLGIGNYLEYKHDEGTAIYSVGDNVVCEAGEKRYIGKIASIGYYRKDKDSEPQPAIYIDTTKTKTSYSGEVVMAGDITYLYNGSAAYRREAVQNLIDIILDYRNSMKEEDQDKIGKVLMGLWNLGTQKEEYVHKIAEYMTE
jgi:hypothetical protein